MDIQSAFENPPFSPDDEEDEEMHDIDWDNDVPLYDDEGNIFRIEHPDGSVSISLDGEPLRQTKIGQDDGWFSNLAEHMEERELHTICDTLITRIDEDRESRKQRLGTETADIMNLMGLYRKTGNSQGISGPNNGLTNTDLVHPILLEAVVSHQAGMNSELLPADGPVKVHDYTSDRMGQALDETGVSPPSDELADELETSLNHYLLEGDTGYYAETDRLLFMGGATGDGFQKVHNCPIRRKPVIDTVDYDHLVINVSARSLEEAERITQIEYIPENVVRRMQVMGIYRDANLVRPMIEDQSSAYDNAKNRFQGIAGIEPSPDDDAVNRKIYECRCNLDLPGYEHKYKGEASRIRVPYVVTIDADSKEILAIFRNYFEDDPNQEAIPCFVQFPFIPAQFGFYSIGLYSLLQNPTRALSRAWRILLDKGFLSNYPAFLYKRGVRNDSMVLQLEAGKGTGIDVGVNEKLSDVISPVPYTDIGPNFPQFMQSIADSFKSVTNAAEKMVAEGHQNAPVGTTVALLEAAQQVMSAVHKRYVNAQGKTFKILLECFKRDPDAFLRFDKSHTRKWDMDRFMQALDRFNLVPKADPNTASHIQRMTRLELLAQRAQAQPELYNQYEVEAEILRAAKLSSPERFLRRPSPPTGMPSPVEQAQQKMVEAKMKEADSKMMMAQAKIQENRVNMVDSQADATNRQQDRESRENIEALKFMREEVVHPEPGHAMQSEAMPLIHRLVQSNIPTP